MDQTKMVSKMIATKQDFFVGLKTILKKHAALVTDYQLKSQFFYTLAMLISNEPATPEAKWSLVLSAKWLDNKNEKKVIKELYDNFHKFFDAENFSNISRITIIKTSDPVIQNFTFNLGNTSMKDISGRTFGDIFIHKGIVLECYSRLSKSNKEESFYIHPVNGKPVRGLVKRINENNEVIYYTDKGLKVLFQNQKNARDKQRDKILINKDEKFLFENGYLQKIAIQDIEDIC